MAHRKLTVCLWWNPQKAGCLGGGKRVGGGDREGFIGIMSESMTVGIWMSPAQNG